MKNGSIVRRKVLRTLRKNKAVLVTNALLQNGQKEPLSCRKGNVLKWYCCGPTVYDDAHLGHARAGVSFDIIRRIISSLTNATVIFAFGLTDVDDKILTRAAQRSVPPQALAQYYEARFFQDMKSLNILPPTRLLRVTEHIGHLKKLIQELISSKAAYVTDMGNVYFSVNSCGERYAQLDPSRSLFNTSASISPTNESSHSSIPNLEKRDVRDFALWKRVDDLSRGGQWDSPWGKGRPGWHVECSAMARFALGPYLDLHTGGIDLRFPHHTNELAISEASLCPHNLPLCNDGEQERWSHTWMHAGHLHMDGRKMSKSLKNFITVRQFLQQGSTADEFRTFCLFRKYSSPVSYSEEHMTQARSYLSRVKTFLAKDPFSDVFRERELGYEPDAIPMDACCPQALQFEEKTKEIGNDIEDALTDDFDTPRAMSKLSQLMTASNSMLTKEGTVVSGTVALAYDEARQLVRRTLGMLGISSSLLIGQHNTAEDSVRSNIDGVTDLFVKFRGDVRSAVIRKDIGGIFELCDRSRDDARIRFGIRMLDRTDGSTSWTKD